jgi:ubiquinone biosynthesis protein UbiJ
MRLLDPEREGVAKLRRREAELAHRIAELERSEVGPEAVLGLHVELDKVRRRLAVLVMPWRLVVAAGDVERIGRVERRS